jgi:hypothetical protein
VHVLYLLALNNEGLHDLNLKWHPRPEEWSGGRTFWSAS